MRSNIPLLGGESTHRVAKIKDQQTINFWPKIESPDAKGGITLQATPGLSKITTVNTGPSRANMVAWGGDLYGVSGNQLFKKDTSDVITAIGTLNTSSGWCVIARGRDYIMITDGTNGYTYNGTTFAQIADADFLNGSTHCAYMNGYYIAHDPTTDQFAVSAVEDPTSWDALDFATAEASGDFLLAMIARDKDLYLFGDQTIEIYYISGNADFPLSPYPNTIEYGIHAKYSVVKNDNGVYLLAQKEDGVLVVVHIQGFSGTIISDPDITETINALTTTSDAIGGLTSIGGQSFYVLTFPSEDLTYSFNLNTNMVHRLKGYGIGRYRGLGFGALGNRQFCMDYDNAKLYELSTTKYTDDGGVIERYRRSQVIHNNDQWVYYSEIVIDALVGQGNGDEPNPVIELRYSDDGANTWSSWYSRSLGAVGEYNTRCVWRRLGRSRGRIFEFRVTDPINVAIINAFADVDVLSD